MKRRLFRRQDTMPAFRLGAVGVRCCTAVRGVLGSPWVDASDLRAVVGLARLVGLGRRLVTLVEGLTLEDGGEVARVGIAIVK